ncbi:CAAD domain-containing protein [Synechococcus sp. BA-132 BA5]|uniref:CAAD domain-containing protein n=1 Tax=Synechococcus sp. BA-132 BA5 TaxID=3110252 RepID=UPI002B1FDA34|nr:CAAD domain-containing protein [Synechococcus sp. BA-132 BA5]MEA5416343.1 CAAD domain-containing protein [Synechococcus sp. BA-132 BA5]
MAETPFSPESPFSPEPPLSPEGQENGLPSQPWPADAAEATPDPVTPESEPILAGPDPEADSPEELAPEPVMEPVVARVNEPEAGIVATFEVPPLEGSADPDRDGGGEFDLLLQKIKDWLGSGELQAQWQRFRGPLKGLAILIGVVLLLRVYAALIGTLDSLPLVGGLLELVGLIAATRFSITRMVRRSDREQVFADWSRRWNDFRGRE